MIVGDGKTALHPLCDGVLRFLLSKPHLNTITFQPLLRVGIPKFCGLQQVIFCSWFIALVESYGSSIEVGRHKGWINFNGLGKVCRGSFTVTKISFYTATVIVAVSRFWINFNGFCEVI